MRLLLPLALVSGIACGAVPAPCHAAAPPQYQGRPQAAPPPAIARTSAGSGPLPIHTVAEQYLFRSVNAERAVAGLPPLTWNLELDHAARYHADRIRYAASLSHQLDGEADLTARAAASGARFSRVEENVAVGPSILEIHTALMHSPHHRENILDPIVNSMAVSVLADRNGDLWAVEDFTRDIEALTYQQQERRVLDALPSAGIVSRATEDARSTCRLSTGFTGQRPAFVMRYTTSDLGRLPDQLTTRLSSGTYRYVAVGACKPEDHGGFTSYNIAVILYR